MIKPTNGRVLWFYARVDVDQPEAAMVTWVHSDRLVNLIVHNPHGVSRGETSVYLVQDDADIDEAIKNGNGRFARWMPYQTGQARQQVVRQDREENTSSAVAMPISEDQETETQERTRRGWLGITARPRATAQAGPATSIGNTVQGEARITGRVD